LALLVLEDLMITLEIYVEELGKLVVVKGYFVEIVVGKTFGRCEVKVGVNLF
jgi:hypothetical protein